MAMTASALPQTLYRIRTAQGFTLIELVAVMIVIGILAAAVLPRFVGVNAFDTFGFIEQTSQMLRYGQKSAIARRRTVCISQSGAAVIVRYANTADSASCTSDLLNPADGTIYSRPIPSGVSLSGLSGTIRFNALGQPVDSSGIPLASNQTLTISGEFSRTLTIEAETGHVY